MVSATRPRELKWELWVPSPGTSITGEVTQTTKLSVLWWKLESASQDDIGFQRRAARDSWEEGPASCVTSPDSGVLSGCLSCALPTPWGPSDPQVQQEGAQADTVPPECAAQSLLLFVTTPAFTGSSWAPRDSRARMLTLGTCPQQFLGRELGDIIWEQSLFPGGASQGSVGYPGPPHPAVHKAEAATPRTLKSNFLRPTSFSPCGWNSVTPGDGPGAI